jgi:hypothetical protein
MKGIIQDDLDNLIDRLKEDNFDSEEFGLRRYEASDSSKVTVDGEDVHVIPGTFPYPVSSFVVKDGDFSKYSDDPPGILPYINGGYNLRGADPSPRTIGIPLISGEQQGKIGIRWLFREGGYNSGLTMWNHLSEDEVSDLDGEIVPDKSGVISTREGKDLSPAQSHPEPVDDVRNRQEELWWECWCSRCQELMNSWRVLIPNTSKTPLPTVLAPSNSIISDNFNVILTPDKKTAMAIAAVFGTGKAQEFLKSVSPWSKGDTPRPRGRHVIATLDQNLSIIEEILANEGTRLSDRGDELEQFYDDMLEVLKPYIGGSGGITLRDRYTSIPDSTDLDSEILGVAEGSDNLHVTVLTEDEEVEIGFHDEEYTSAMAHAAWIGAGFDDTIDSVLDTPSVETDFAAVEAVLYQESFQDFCQTVEEDYF